MTLDEMLAQSKTLNEMLAQSKTLNDDDLTLLCAKLSRELEERQNAEERQAWNKVCEAIDAYVHKYGYFTINIGDNDECVLYRGDYAFGIGEISILE